MTITDAETKIEDAQAEISAVLLNAPISGHTELRFALEDAADALRKAKRGLARIILAEARAVKRCEQCGTPGSQHLDCGVCKRIAAEIRIGA